MANTGQTVEVNLINSIDIDKVKRDVYSFDDQSAPHNKNTGIERRGGLQPIYEQETAYAETGTHFVTEDANVLSAVDIVGTDIRDIRVNGSSIGQVSQYGIQSRTTYKGLDDCRLSAAETLIAIKINQNVITISEYSLSNVLLNSRTVTFTNLTPVFYKYFTSLTLVEYQDMAYADSQEFLLRLGDQAIFLKESTPNQVIVLSGANSSALGSNTINAAIVYNNFLIVAGNGGRVASFDGSLWKNYDGTGLGTGPWNNATVISTSNINCLAVFTTSSGATLLVVAGDSGRLGSYDGFTWTVYTAGGTTLSNNGTAIGTDPILSVVQFGIFLVVAGGTAATSGRVGNWTEGTGWVNYNAAGTGATILANNSTALGASNQIRAVSVYNNQLIFAGQGGRLASANLAVALSTKANLASGGVSVVSVAGNQSGVFVAIATGSSPGSIPGYFWRSTNNGVTWSGRSSSASSLTSPPRNIAARQNGSTFVAVWGQTLPSPDGFIRRSTDGGASWSTIVSGSTPYDFVECWQDGGTNYCLAANVSGTYRRSTNDGSSFASAQTIPTLASISCVKYLGSSTVFVGGPSGTYAISTNNGSSWSTGTLTGWSTNGILSADSNNGVIIVAGANGTYSRSTNGGVSFSAASTISGWTGNINGVVGFYPDNWVLVGPSGQVSYSTNGGASFSASAVASGWTGLSINSIAKNSLTNNVVAVGGTNGYSTTSTGAASWKNYDGTGSGSAIASLPASNGTIIGTNQINCLQVYSPTNQLAVAGVGGRVGSILGTTITAYTAGSGLSNNAGVVGSEDIISLTQFGSTLVFGSGTTGRLGSYDGTNFKNYDGTGAGTGVYNNGTLVGPNPIKALCQFNSVLWAFGLNLSNNIDSAGNFVPFYVDGSTFIANLLTGIGNASVYVFRYDPEGAYLVLPINASPNTGYMVHPDLVTVATLKARYCVRQTQISRSRHLLTETPRVSSGDIKVTSLVGYNDFNVFSYTQVYPTTGLSTVNFILQGNIGYGYADIQYRTSASGTDINTWYTPVPVALPTSWFTLFQCNTQTYVNGYGKLNNQYGSVPSKAFEFRSVLIQQEQSAISIGMIDGISTDPVGTLVTNIGEWDTTYCYQIKDSDKILYKFDGSFIVVKIGKTQDELFQKISSDLYKINTIHPSNLYSDNNKQLFTGSLDFNGREFFTSTAAPASTAVNVASIITNQYANSIDVGDKVVQINPITSANIQVFGFRLPSQYSIVTNFQVDVYISDIYSFSVFNDGSEASDSAKAGVPYLNLDTVPVAIGGDYHDNTVIINNVTLILNPNYDGYIIGNDLQGSYIGFLLYSQNYFFDGNFIYKATLTNNILTDLVKLANANGVSFLTVSPIEAFFLSDFDNSLYSFQGNQNLNKTKRFTGTAAIQQAVFNVKDNTLLVETEDSLVWIRDGIATENLKKSNQTGLSLYDTTDGVVVSNNIYKWRYTYSELPGSTVVPFTFQTAYFGMLNNIRSILKEVVVTIYSADRVAMTVKMTIDSYDQDNQYVQDVFLTVKPSDYTENGYCRLRVQPEFQRSLGASARYYTEQFALLQDVALVFEPETGAVIKQGLSK